MDENRVSGRSDENLESPSGMSKSRGRRRLRRRAWEGAERARELPSCTPGA